MCKYNIIKERVLNLPRQTNSKVIEFQICYDTLYQQSNIAIHALDVYNGHCECDISGNCIYYIIVLFLETAYQG